MSPPAFTPTELAVGIGRTLRQHPEVAAAWLFGSAVRGELRPDSDVDVGLVLAERRDTPEQYHRVLGTIAAEIEQVTGGRLVDLVVLDPIRDPMFCHRVLSEGLLVHDADPDRRVDFESTAHVRYFDWLPTWSFAAPHALAGTRARMERRR